MNTNLFAATRRRLAIWNACTMGGIFLVAALAFYGWTTKQQYAGVDGQLTTLANTVVSAIEIRRADNPSILHAQVVPEEKKFEDDTDDQVRPLQPIQEVTGIQISLHHVPYIGEEGLPLELPGGYVRWYDIKGNPVRFLGPTPPKRLTVAPGYLTLPGNIPYRQKTVAVRAADQVLGYMQVGASLVPTKQSLDILAAGLAAGVPMVLLLVAGASWWFAGLAITPLEASHDRLQRFTADASHELRTPLATLLAGAQLTLEQEPLSAPVRERLELVTRSAERMSRILTDLLFLARSDRRMAITDQQMCNLSEILQDAIEEITPLAVKSGLHLRHQDVMAAAVWGNAEQLYRLFANLLTNAVKYTPVGGRITVTMQILDRQVVVQVEDSGIGIAPEHQEKVFERFYRVDSSRSRQAGGSGLGLAMCRAIAQVHGGNVVLTRSTEQGSMFMVTLPMATVALKGYTVPLPKVRRADDSH